VRGDKPVELDKFDLSIPVRLNRDGLFVVKEDDHFIDKGFPVRQDRVAIQPANSAKEMRLCGERAIITVNRN